MAHVASWLVQPLLSVLDIVSIHVCLHVVAIIYLYPPPSRPIFLYPNERRSKQNRSSRLGIRHHDLAEKGVSSSTLYPS